MVVVTNQAGIGRGLYDWEAFGATQAHIEAALGAAGAVLDMVIACPFHPEGRPPYQHPDHPCRKPNPGMLLRAGQALDLDLADSWIVGDRGIDLEAGRAAGLAGGLHLRTGYGDRERAVVSALEGEGFRVLLGDSILEALDRLPLLAARG